MRRLNRFRVTVALLLALLAPALPAAASGCTSHYNYVYDNATTRHWTGNRVWNGSMYVKVTWVQKAGPGYWYDAYQLIYAC